MIRVTRRDNPDGSISIKIGRTTTVLHTETEADAFFAGVKIAHAALARKIEPILKVKDGRL